MTLEEQEKELEELEIKEQKIREEIRKQENNGNYAAILCLRGNLNNIVQLKNELKTSMGLEKMLEKYRKKVKRFEG